MLLVVLLSSGCSWLPTRTIIETQTVNVPVMIYPDIPAIPRPELSIHKDNLDTDTQLVKAYKKTVIQLIDYSTDLETVIDSIRTEHQVLDD